VRKTEYEIKDRAEIDAILNAAQVCRIALADGNMPYIVPVNFGYKDNCLYFHCALEGKKLDIIRRNNNVCFEADADVQIIPVAGKVCNWNTRYRSVIGFGKAFILADWQEKAAALNVVTAHYGAAPYAFTEKELERVGIVKVAISNMTGKKARY
jgi:uncharacterized protein